MLATHWFRMGACLSVVMAGCSLVSSCASSPTYGTDKTAMEQLTDDLGQSVSLTGPDPKNKGVKYTPRPTLVLLKHRRRKRPSLRRSRRSPTRTIRNGLNRRRRPAPVSFRKPTRIRTIRITVRRSQALRSKAAKRTTEAQTKAYREARALQKGSYVDQRRYISDPPPGYRTVDDPAKLDDVGEPELKKQKKRKKDAAVANTGKQWWNLLQ